MKNNEFYENKNDKNKLKYGLIDPEFITLLAEVMTHGAEKYSSNSWKHVPKGKERYIDAAYRHWNGYLKGSMIDEESGLPTLAHCAANLMFILYFDREKG